MNSRIAILNYGVGNIAALMNMLDFIGEDAVVVSASTEVAAADKLILPGVGAFDSALRRLDLLGVRGALFELAKVRQRPVLGVCLGMQMLGRSSEEGSAIGLGLINAETRKIRPNDQTLKVPHMGWAELRLTRQSTLFPDIAAAERFYFAHSYHVVCENPDHVLAQVYHGTPLTASLMVDNVMGVQFHPEKSHRFGTALLKRFARL
jgi:glutamine amidotransferase